MKKILTDQNFDGPTLRGLIARIPDLDVVRTEDVGLKRFHDKDIIEWAAEENRLILTHDARTFIDFAYKQMTRGKNFCGVVVVPRSLSIRRSIEELMTVILCTDDDELYNTVVRLPL
jgi:predicted nuclease of predicted toxin-antitoxin system